MLYCDINGLKEVWTVNAGVAGMIIRDGGVVSERCLMSLVALWYDMWGLSEASKENQQGESTEL